MDIVVHVLLIVPFLMGMAIGYVFKDWIRSIKKKRTIKRANKEFYKEYPLSADEAYNDGKPLTNSCREVPLFGFDQEDADKLDKWNINYHSTSTQGPPRRSAMATLEDLLESALKLENYEIAAKLRDRINKLKNNEDNNSC